MTRSKFTYMLMYMILNYSYLQGQPDYLTHLTSFPTVMLAMTFFIASFFTSLLSPFNSAFNSNNSPLKIL